MNGYSRIPEKIKNIAVISGVEFDIDSEGLDCIIRPRETDIWIYLKQGNTSEKYFIKSGESFEFCGKLYFMASTSGSVQSFMYKTL